MVCEHKWMSFVSWSTKLSYTTKFSANTGGSKPPLKIEKPLVILLAAVILAAFKYPVAKSFSGRFTGGFSLTAGKSPNLHQQFIKCC